MSTIMYAHSYPTSLKSIIDLCMLLCEWELNLKQDGPSLESSSYLNVTLKYIGTLGPLDPGTLGLLDFLLTPFTSFYILLLLLTSFYILLPPGLVWFGMGGGSFMSFHIWDWDLRLTLDLYIEVKKLWVGGGGAFRL